MYKRYILYLFEDTWQNSLSLLPSAFSTYHDQQRKVSVHLLIFTMSWSKAFRNTFLPSLCISFSIILFGCHETCFSFSLLTMWLTNASCLIIMFGSLVVLYVLAFFKTSLSWLSKVSSAFLFKITFLWLRLIFLLVYYLSMIHSHVFLNSMQD